MPNSQVIFLFTGKLCLVFEMESSISTSIPVNFAILAVKQNLLKYETELAHFVMENHWVGMPTLF